jgi:hypothetical protein
MIRTSWTNLFATSKTSDEMGDAWDGFSLLREKKFLHDGGADLCRGIGELNAKLSEFHNTVELFTGSE